MLLLACFGIEIGVTALGVAMISVDSIMAWLTTPEGPSTLHIWKIVGVAEVFLSTCGTGLSTSSLVIFLVLSARKVASCVTVATRVVGPLVDSLVSLNITEKNYLQPKIFINSPSLESFRVCDIRTCNFLSETNKFCLGAFLALFLISTLQKRILSHQASNPIQFSLVWYLFVLFEVNKFCLGTVHFSCLLLELLKSPLVVIEPRTIFLISGFFPATLTLK